MKRFLPVLGYGAEYRVLHAADVLILIDHYLRETLRRAVAPARTGCPSSSVSSRTEHSAQGRRIIHQAPRGCLSFVKLAGRNPASAPAAPSMAGARQLAARSGSCFESRNRACSSIFSVAFLQAVPAIFRKLRQRRVRRISPAALEAGSTLIGRQALRPVPAEAQGSAAARGADPPSACDAVRIGGGLSSPAALISVQHAAPAPPAQ